MVRGGGVRKSRFTAGEKAVSPFTPVLKRSISRSIPIAVCLYHVPSDRDLMSLICIILQPAPASEWPSKIFLLLFEQFSHSSRDSHQLSSFHRAFFTIARRTNHISCTALISGISQFTRTVACAQSEYTD